MNNPHNSRGASILFVLAALIVTGFIGVSMIKMVASDRMSNALYSTSASARSAAKSGIISAVHWFEDAANNGEIINLLNAWVGTATPPTSWLLDTDGDTYRDIILNDTVSLSATANPKFNIRLLAFDNTNMTITLMSQGIGKGGARATTTTVHRLDGLGYNEVYDWANENALYIGDGINISTHDAFNIKGNVYMDGNSVQHWDSDILNSVFDGDFVFSKGTGSLRIDGVYGNMGGITFKKKAYFGVQPYLTGHAKMYCKDKAGFEKGIKYNGGGNYTGIQNDSYWNGNAFGNSTGDANLNNYSKNTWHNGTLSPVNVLERNREGTVSIPLNKYIVPTSDLIAGNDINIPESLKVEIDQCDIDVDPSVVTNKVAWNTPSVTFTGAMAQTFYNNQKAANKLWNGFAVYELQSKMLIGGGASTYFNDKLMIITNGNTIQTVAGSKMFSSGPKANIAIINNGGIIKDIGGWNKFRGFIWAGAGSQLIIGATGVPVNPITGCVHAADGVTNMQWYPDASVTSLTYDPKVMEELDYDGFLSMPCKDHTKVPTGDLIIKSVNLTASLVSETK